MVVEIFETASLNRPMNTSSLVADSKGHEDQRMIAPSEMNYSRATYFFGRTSYTEINQRSRGGCNCGRFRIQCAEEGEKRMNVLTKANLDTSLNRTASLPKPANSTNHYIPPQAYHLEAVSYTHLTLPTKLEV